MLGNLIESNEFINTDKKIPLIIGTDLNGKNIIEDLAVLPHLLIAGTTGVGKSILLSTFIVDMIYKFNPDELKLVLIDTRKNNFLRFEGLPHLLTPIITDSEKSIRVISKLIEIMGERHKLFDVENVDNIDNYNEVANVKLPRIVVIIEDFGDLMLDTSSEIQEYIVRLAQMSREVGIHLIISTQRPSVNVLTGRIKSNLPARIAFNVPSHIDSRTIIDVANAEKLLLYGDILYRKPGVTRLERIQTPYISDGEINNILNYIKENNSSIISNMSIEVDIEEDQKEIDEDEKDPLLEDIIEYIIEIGQASPSIIQRKFKVGYARAGRIIDQMEERGIISPYQGSKPREVLINRKRWLEINNNCIEDNEKMEDRDIELEDNAIENSSMDNIDEIEENEENVDENILKNKWFWIWGVIIIGIIIGMIG